MKGLRAAASSLALVCQLAPLTDSGAVVSVTGADAVLGRQLVPATVVTSQRPLSTLFLSRADAVVTGDLARVVIPTQKVHVSRLFVLGEDASFTGELTAFVDDGERVPPDTTPSEPASVDTVAPRLVSSSPADGATGVDPTALNSSVVSVRFDESVVSVSARISADGRSIGGARAALAADPQTVYVWPDSVATDGDFRHGVQYQIELAVTDEAGNERSVEVRFATSAAEEPMGARRVSLLSAAEVVAPGDEFGVSVDVSEADGISGIELSVVYDEATLEAVDVGRGELLAARDDMSFVKNLDIPGQVRLIIAGAPGLEPGSGTLAFVSFRAVPGAVEGAYELRLEDVVLIGESREEITHTSEPAEVAVRDLQAGGGMEGRVTVSLDLDPSIGNQGVTELSGVSRSAIVPVEVYVQGVEGSVGLTLAFEYDGKTLSYRGFVVGSAIQGATTLADTGAGYAEVGVSILGQTFNFDSGMLGTARFHTEDAFLEAELQLVRVVQRRPESRLDTLLPDLTLTLTSCLGADFDCDGEVGFNDFFLFSEAFGMPVTAANSQFDLDQDGKIGFTDFFLFSEGFGGSRARLRALAHERIGLPVDPELKQNYPNPFNSSTVVRFLLPADQRVALVVYDMVGARVRSLVDERLSHGIHAVTWDGTDDAGRSVASGGYVLRMQAEGAEFTRKMLLVR